MSNVLRLRTDAKSTTHFVDTTITYAELSAVREIRLCISRKYVEGAELPGQDHTLIHNSPLLQVLVVVALPGISDKLYIAHDSPGLTMQREPREAEVRALVSRLLEVAPEKVFYGTQPIDATSYMPAENAVAVMSTIDYAQLTVATESDFFRRLKGY